MSKENKYTLGKCDYNNSGRKNCEAAFTWKLKDGKFFMCAEIWNPKKTDIYTGGQCIEEVLKYFPYDARAQAMARVWRQYHLNDMQAGSPAQTAHLEANEAEYTIAREHGIDHYDWAKATLEAAGLEPDPNYIHNGKPYSYGSSWLKTELPPDAVKEVESWGTGEQTPPGIDPSPGAFDAFLAARYDFGAVYVEAGQNSDEYRCTFTHKNKYDAKGKATPRLRVPYFQGKGHRKNQLGQAWDKHKADADYIGLREAFSPKKSAPSASAVMAALVMDAHAYLENQDVADFCENFGYEFREGRRVHSACEQTYADLREFAGADFNYLMNEEDA